MLQIKDFSKNEGKVVGVQGWVANKREGKTLVFLVLRDGSGFAQCVINAESVEATAFAEAKNLTTESAVELEGTVVKDEKQVGGYELQVSGIRVLSLADEYPITPKEHGDTFLADNRHLWLRSKRQWAIMRIRNEIIYAIHNFFQSEDFVQMDAPIFTGNACEGTSDLFETQYFDKTAYLTQSGQLYGEAMAMAMSKIYTFGPTFRAEKSRTRRHLTEFWMMEPEMAFYDNEQNMDLIERMLNSVLSDVLEKCQTEFEVIDRDTEMLKKSVAKFPRLTYDEAVAILKGEQDVDGKNAIKTLKADMEEVVANIETVTAEIAEREEKISQPGIKKGERNFNQNKIDQLKNRLKELQEDERNIPNWIASAEKFEYGNDFGGSDETVLTRLFDVPVMVYNWPHKVKAFYMKRDDSNPELAKGVDVLAPEGYGEIIGGGERETDKELLIEKIKEHKLPMNEFEWYLDLRRYGSVPHAGFGVGLERLVCWICKLSHVRESVPFPRWYGRLLP